MFINFFRKRSELFICENSTMSAKQNFLFYFIFFFSLNWISDFKKRSLVFSYLYDLSFTNHGWRFYKNLPVRGQRTWTNSNTAFIKNNSVKNYKIFFIKSFLGLSSSTASSVLMLEYYNLLWKLQWEDEWFELRKYKLRGGQNLKKNFKNNTIQENDILAELIFIRNKFLKKKVRIQFKGGSYLLGFQPSTVLHYN